MFGFDIFPIAAASLDMTADFAHLLSGLGGLLGLSAVAIVVSAVSFWMFNPRRTAASPTATASSDLDPHERGKSSVRKDTATATYLAGPYAVYWRLAFEVDGTAP